jgi:RNA polymerase sigma-70 factor (ECF subfamily)
LGKGCFCPDHIFPLLHKTCYTAFLSDYPTQEGFAMTNARPEELLRNARAGDQALLGALLERYRPHLKLLARLRIGRELHSKVDPSDVVQDTFLQAHRHFAGFQGHTANEFRVWLHQIMTSTLANVVRHYVGTQGRDVRREQPLPFEPDLSRQHQAIALAAPVSTPSQQAARREISSRLALALAKLPDDYREVLVLRHLEGLSFPEVARRMARSQDSVDKLWLRALARLRPLLGGGTP